MSTGTLENKSQQKSGRAIALPAPPPPRSLLLLTYTLSFISELSRRFAAIPAVFAAELMAFFCLF